MENKIVEQIYEGIKSIMDEKNADKIKDDYYGFEQECKAVAIPTHEVSLMTRWGLKGSKMAQHSARRLYNIDT